MRRLAIRTLLATGAAAAAVGLSATAAFAAPWTIAGNGNADGSVGGDAGTTTLNVTDPAGNTTLSCVSSHTDANVPNGTASTNAIGTISGLSFTQCNFGGFFAFTVTTSGFPYTLNALSQAGDTISGSVTGTIRAHISGPGCEADIGGSTVPGTFSNTNEDLNIPGTGQDLTITGVDASNNCLGRIHVGDPANFAGDYFVDQPIQING